MISFSTKTTNVVCTVVHEIWRKVATKQKRESEMKPVTETEKAETDRIKKMKLSFFTINGDTPITLLALNGIFPRDQLNLDS